MTDPTIAAWSRENDLLFQLRQLREENERLRFKMYKDALGEKHMRGDHNMYQKTTGVHEQKFYDERSNLAQPTQDLMSDPEVEQYKSQIERQCVEMQATIDLLKATVETLYLRLKPVMADAPMRTATNEVSPVVSPLGLSINQYRQQTTVVIDELIHIIESLEI